MNKWVFGMSFNLSCSEHHRCQRCHCMPTDKSRFKIIWRNYPDKQPVHIQVLRII